MRKFFLLYILLFNLLIIKAQESCPNNLLNTFKERIKLLGYVQVGYTYNDATPKTNNFDIKRAILVAGGQITDRWSCAFMYSLANKPELLEAYTEYRLLPQLNIRIGQFKTMYTLESQLSPCVTELINCTSQAVSYLAGINGSDPLYGFTTGRDMGLLLYGNLCNNMFDYHLGIMNGQGINLRDRNAQKDIVGSLSIYPLKWLVVNGSFIKGKGCAKATSTVNPDIEIGENYRRDRWSIGATMKTKPLEIRTEYLAGIDGEIRSRGYYLTASVHVLPKFDIIASYDYFDKNKEESLHQINYVTGIQYWFYPQCRMQLQYTYSNQKAGSDASLLQAQLQVRF